MGTTQHLPTDSRSSSPQNGRRSVLRLRPSSSFASRWWSARSRHSAPRQMRHPSVKLVAATDRQRPYRATSRSRSGPFAASQPAGGGYVGLDRYDLVMQRLISIHITVSSWATRVCRRVPPSATPGPPSWIS